LRLDAGSTEAHTLLGIILFTRGGAAVEARDALAQATALDSGSFDAFYYLGRVQGDMKDYTGAIASLRTAVKLDPRHQFARFLLGYALEVTGQLDAAGVLDVISGRMPGEPYYPPPLRRPLSQEVGADPGRLRIGVLDRPGAGGYLDDPQCRAAVAGAGRLLGRPRISSSMRRASAW